VSAGAAAPRGDGFDAGSRGSAQPRVIQRSAMSSGASTSIAEAERIVGGQP